MAMTMEWWWQYSPGGNDIYLLHHPRFTGRVAPTPDGQRWSWRIQGADGVSEGEGDAGTEDGAFAAAEAEIEQRSTAHGRLRRQRERDA